MLPITYLTILFLWAEISKAAPILNIVNCDPNASIYSGCHLQDFNNKWITTNCTDGYTLSMDNTCITPCAAGGYMFGDQCISCGANCDECFGEAAFQCASCSANYELNFQNFCQFQCDPSRRLYGLAPNATSPNNQCFECDDSCSTCFVGYQTGCTSCPTSVSGQTSSLKIFDYSAGRTNSGVCIRTPTVDYSNYYRSYPGDRVVIECPIGCSRCTDQFLCTACAEGYALYPPASSGAGYALCYSISSSG